MTDFFNSDLFSRIIILTAILLVIDACRKLLWPKRWKATHRHIRRGGLYQYQGRVRAQCDTQITDMQTLVLYQSEDGHQWVRPYDEFDERFEEVE